MKVLRTIRLTLAELFLVTASVFFFHRGLLSAIPEPFDGSVSQRIDGADPGKKGDGPPLPPSKCKKTNFVCTSYSECTYAPLFDLCMGCDPFPHDNCVNSNATVFQFCSPIMGTQGNKSCCGNFWIGNEVEGFGCSCHILTGECGDERPIGITGSNGPPDNCSNGE